MMNKIVFHLDEETFDFPCDIDIIYKTKKDIANVMIGSHEYHVNSKVQTKIFQAFLNYWIDENNKPEINMKNFWGYIQLSEEFGLMKDILKSDIYLDIFNLSILTNADNNSNFDKNSIELYIANNLDHYLKKFEEELRKVPINNLYNIFNKSEKNLEKHDDAFRFIIKSVNQTNCEYFYVLINCLEINKIKEQNNIKEIFLNYEKFGGFLPKKIDAFFISKEEMIQKMQRQLLEKQKINNEYEEKIKKLEQQLLNKQKQNDEYEEMIKKKENQLLEKQKQNDEYEEKTKKLEQQFLNKQKQNDEYEDRIKKLEQQLLEKQKQNDEHEEKTKKLEQQLLDKDELIGKKDEIILTLQKQNEKTISDLNQKIITTEQNFFKEKEKFIQMKDSLTHMVNHLRENTSSICTINEDYPKSIGINKNYKSTQFESNNEHIIYFLREKQDQQDQLQRDLCQKLKSVQQEIYKPTDWNSELERLEFLVKSLAEVNQDVNNIKNLGSEIIKGFFDIIENSLKLQ